MAVPRRATNQVQFGHTPQVDGPEKPPPFDPRSDHASPQLSRNEYAMENLLERELTVERPRPIPEREQTAELDRMPHLDALRTLAVAGVIVTHTTTFRGKLLGTYGVTLFFVLSGFLITGILLKCRDQAIAHKHRRIHLLKQFYARRFLRIFPLYYLVLTVFWLSGYAPVRDYAGWFFGYLSNFRMHEPALWYSYLGHFWSLAVEEQFYLVWPWVVLWTPPRHLCRLTLAVVALGPLSRGVGAAAGMSRAELWISTLSCLDALGIGALLAVARAQGWFEPLRRAALTYGIAALLLLLASRLLEFPVASQALWSLGPALLSAWLVASASHGFSGIIGRIASWPALLWIGTISYGVYVYHMLVLLVVHKTLHSIPGLLLPLLVTSLTVGVAALSWYAFERPINNLKKYFPYS